MSVGVSMDVEGFHVHVEGAAARPSEPRLAAHAAAEFSTVNVTRTRAPRDARFWGLGVDRIWKVCLGNAASRPADVFTKIWIRKRT